MRIIYRLLTIILWSGTGFFIGTSIYRCYDYYAHPDKYLVTSAPWYLSIQINAVFTVIFASVLLVIMWLIKKRIKQDGGSLS